MTQDEIIAEFEADLVKIAVTRALSSLAAIPFFASLFAIPVLGPVASWAISLAVTKVAALVVKQLDMAGYFLFKCAKNNLDAEAYEDSVLDNQKAVESGDTDAIAKTEAARKAAFAKLAVLTN